MSRNRFKPTRVGLCNAMPEMRRQLRSRSNGRQWSPLPSSSSSRVFLLTAVIEFCSDLTQKHLFDANSVFFFSTRYIGCNNWMVSRPQVKKNVLHSILKKYACWPYCWSYFLPQTVSIWASNCPIYTAIRVIFVDLFPFFECAYTEQFQIGSFLWKKFGSSWNQTSHSWPDSAQTIDLFQSLFGCLSFRIVAWGEYNSMKCFSKNCIAMFE